MTWVKTEMTEAKTRQIKAIRDSMDFDNMTETVNYLVRVGLHEVPDQHKHE